MQETKTVRRILQISERFRNHLQELLEPWGLTPQQYKVLRILREEGGEGGLPTLEIAERMLEKTPGVTRLLDRLEQKGWVTRERNLEDRRKVLCRATKGAVDLLTELDGPVTEVDRLMMSRLNSAEQKALEVFLARMSS